VARWDAPVTPVLELIVDHRPRYQVMMCWLPAAAVALEERKKDFAPTQRCKMQGPLQGAQAACGQQYMAAAVGCPPGPPHVLRVHAGLVGLGSPHRQVPYYISQPASSLPPNPYTVVRTTVSVLGWEMTGIIDSGASNTVMSYGTASKLQLAERI
jgi:hypothetical protein